MRAIGMLPRASGQRRRVEPFVARSSHWVRAPESGILRSRLRLGARIESEQPLGVISSPLDETEVELRAPRPGVLIGRSQLPLVNEGDAVFHVASFDRPGRVAHEVESFQEELLPPEG
jgi:predicted deacylase